MKTFASDERTKQNPWKKKLLMTLVNNLLDKEFKALLIRMLTGLGKRTDEHSENFNKELKKEKSQN